MRIWSVLGAAALIAAAPVQADTLFGIYAGYGSWHHDSTGSVTAGDGASRLDVDEDLALGDDQDDLYYVAVEHGLPFVPNIRAQHASFGTDGLAEAGRTLTFNGLTFQPPTAIDTRVFVEQTDVILYYELLDNALSLDVGVGARMLDGKVSIGSNVQRSTVEFDGTIPILYSAVRFELLGGWWTAAEVQGMAYDDSELIDGIVKLGWESPYGIGLEAGYKWIELTLDDVDEITEASIEFQGPYAALNYHF